MEQKRGWQTLYKLRTTQRAMERQILGITWRDHKRNTWIGQTTKIKDVAKIIAERKWNFTGHVARDRDNKS